MLQNNCRVLVRYDGIWSSSDCLTFSCSGPGLSTTESLADDLFSLSLDPLNWKDQDHYLLLGLADLRYRATGSDIKKAYRKMILKYHPDKTQQVNRGTDDKVFKCIQKAYEILGDVDSRRTYDSVDPYFDESIPSSSSLKAMVENPQMFYQIFSPVFERNGRFSRVGHVPVLGNGWSIRMEVEKFYDFWLNFDSDRTFDYLDEEDTDQASNRSDKRYLEKKNKAARVKRKSEDNARIRKLVELAMRSDPRLKVFKEQDKQEREAKKQQKTKSKTNVVSVVTGSSIVSSENDVMNKTNRGENRELRGDAVHGSVENAKDEKIAVVDLGDWTAVEIRALIKACNKIPGGTRGRWEKISSYVREHSGGVSRSIEDIIKKSREILALRDVPDTSEAELQRTIKKRMDPRIPVEETKINVSVSKGGSVIWNQEDQRLLEEGLRKYSAGVLNRWDLIAEKIPGKTREQIVMRFQEIARALREKNSQ